MKLAAWPLKLLTIAPKPRLSRRSHCFVTFGDSVFSINIISIIFKW
jgi:hypothetical protein